MEHFSLIIVLLLILAAEFVNGWTDAPNAIATVVSTRTLSARQAILIATILNILGALSGTAVAKTIGTGIISPEVVDLLTIASAMCAIVIWSTICWYFGIPTSESHALISGLAGAGLAAAGPSALLWEGWKKVFIGLGFSSLLGISAGWILASLVQRLFQYTNPSRSRRRFARLQILSAAFMAFSHGSNDGQKFIGVFALSLVLGGVTSSFSIPFWVVILCALVMGLGTSLGGMRIIHTIGYKMIHLETYQGFAAETASASTIMLASHFGIPLSTTHTISTSILGVGMAKNVRAVRWIVARRIVFAWLLTFPVCGLLSYCVTYLVKLVR